MKAFGREAMLQAYRETNKGIVQREIVARDNSDVERKTMLARLVFRDTVKQMDVGRNGLSLRPTSDKKREREFISSMRLEEGFEVSRLSLLAKGDRISGWMNFDLRYSQTFPRHDAEQSISEFRAQERGPHCLGIASVPSSDTNLWAWRRPESSTEVIGLPIAFGTEEYQFVRSVAGLFLPQVISELEREGL